MPSPRPAERCPLREPGRVPEERRAWTSPVAAAAADAAADAVAAEAAAAAVVAAVAAVAAAVADAEAVAGSGAWDHPGPGRAPWVRGSD